jgi:hypothetical protein
VDLSVYPLALFLLIYHPVEAGAVVEAAGAVKKQPAPQSPPNRKQWNNPG